MPSLDALLARVRARPWRAVATVAAGGAAAVVCLGALIAWSGVYDVAASRGHWAVTDHILRFGMENSVRARAPDVTPVDLRNPDLIRLGAGHYHSGCALCHGAPGSRPNPVVQAMLPSPPDLKDRAPLWSDGELFRLVKHGLKYAGMPAWPTQSRDDEPWAVVAFLRALPSLDAKAYRDLALGPVEINRAEPRELATAESDPDAAGACARCHGAERDGPSNALTPLLHGQKREWLLRSLQDYATGARESGVMQPLAAALDDEAMARLATYYAELRPPPQNAGARDPALVDAGRRLALEGDREGLTPACVNCHGANAAPQFPRIDGLSERYIAAQLRAWKNGKTGASATHAIMAPIAQRLDDAQIAAAAAYFSSRPAGDPPR